MRIREWLHQAGGERLDAGLILLGSLRQEDRSFLVAHSEDELDDVTRKKADGWLSRRQAGEPLAYILGEREFYGRKFMVDERVLIPRPETEILVEMALELGSKKIIEIGTGSGCIAVTLSLESPQTDIIATDIATLDVAKQNYRRLAEKVYTRGKIEFRQADLTQGVEKDLEKTELVIANLPYVDRNWGWNSPELKFEPAGALFAGRNGLETVYKLIEQLGRIWTETKGEHYLLLESDDSQQDDIIEYAKKYGFCLAKRRKFATLLRLNLVFG